MFPIKNNGGKSIQRQKKVPKNVAVRAINLKKRKRRVPVRPFVKHVKIVVVEERNRR
jgi:hypothetical protein